LEFFDEKRFFSFFTGVEKIVRKSWFSGGKFVLTGKGLA
jgi:hypothetical protein